MKYVVGDLIVAAKMGNLDAIAHGCNCHNTMKSGIAPEIARAFPEAWRADQATIKGDRDKLGTFTFSYNTGCDLYVFNLYSQYGYWNRRKGVMDLDYAALDNALLGMRCEVEWICHNDDRALLNFRVGLPKIGAGLAGGDWGVIEPMIEKHLGHFDTTIYVLKESEIVHH